MSRWEFEGELYHSGDPGTWTTLNIPREVSDEFGTKQRIPVSGKINEQPFRSSAMPWGDGMFFLVINKQMQRAAGVGPGDKATVVVEPDTAPRDLVVPSALTEELAKAPEAAERWEGLSYSRRKEYVDWIAEAKREETRERRAQKAVERIAAGQRPRG